MDTSIKYIPYQQDGEPKRRAAVTNVDVDLDGLSEREIQILGHLIDAANGMNAIFRDQFERLTVALSDFVSLLMHVADKNEVEKLENYLTVLDIQNGPYSLLPRKNHLLDISEDRIRELAEKAEIQNDIDINPLVKLLIKGVETPDKANFYPEDITDDELKALEDGKLVNSSVVRDTDGDLHVVYNEDRYYESLKPVIAHLRKARDLTPDTGFRLYLDAKILELETGTDEARRIADYTWVRHNYDLDIVISTALEVYLDNYRNFRGAASGGVYLKNDAAEELLTSLIKEVPYWEKNAPWKYKKEEIDPETLPKLKFVDVLTWAGDYVTGPFTTIAQSLPNDEWVGKNIGTVNMVYMNTGRASHTISGNLAAEEFLGKREVSKVKDVLFDANQLHSALHEIGHTTGRQSSEASDGQPSDYIEEEYSFLEETRAELFGLFALKKLVEEGVIDQTMSDACYDGMLITMIMSMKFDPVQAHNKARNGMFHYFEEMGIVERFQEGGKEKFAIIHDKAHSVVCEMLATVANIKAHGKKNEAIALREKYVYSDPMKDNVESRTADFPLGRGLIFPSLKKDNSAYYPVLEYPEKFSDQEKFKIRIED